MKKYLLIAFILCLIATLAYAVDATYGPKVYKDSGGDREVIASGGEVNYESGGILTFGGTSLTSGTASLLTTTNTATLTNKTLSGATFTGTIVSTATHSGGTYTGSTLTSPAIAFGVASKVFSAGEDWTLSASEATAVLLTLSSGSGTPSIIDAYSTSGVVKIVRNAAAVAVTLKMSGQTGVSVASGTTAVLIHSGTDYVRVTADATH